MNGIWPPLFLGLLLLFLGEEGLPWSKGLGTALNVYRIGNGVTRWRNCILYKKLYSKGVEVSSARMLFFSFVGVENRRNRGNSSSNSNNNSHSNSSSQGARTSTDWYYFWKKSLRNHVLKFRLY